MHELSIVMSIIDIATEQAESAHAENIEEIEMDIGCLTTIDMDAFDFAWQQGVKDSILAGAIKKVNRIKGRANCYDCNTSFSLENVYDACPSCGQHLIHITEGKEMRVKSLVVF